MPTWGMHLLTAKKLNKKLKIDDYNLFLIGNIITDINNGYLVENVLKVIPHKDTHYYSEKKDEKTGKIMFYDVEKFIQDNKENLQNPLILGYIVHLLTDVYWNDLTYTKHGIRDENGKVIGLKLNNGQDLLGDGELRRKTKVNDFKIYTNYLYMNKLIDIPQYDEKVYDIAKSIKCISLEKEDIQKAIHYIDVVKNGITSLKVEYKIFSQEEMLKNIEKCTQSILKYLENII